MIERISTLGLLAALAVPLAGPAFAQDTMRKPNAMSSNAMKHNAMRSDSMSQGGMKKDSMSKNFSTQGAMGSDKMAPK